MNRHLVIVESPTKARTISRFLPKEYEVIASIGHVRDLPKKESELPAQHKGKKWSSLGIDVEHDFTPIYVPVNGKEKIIRSMKEKLKESLSLILATDEDREGESIAHHIVEVIRPSIPVRRMVFHEITKSAVTKALDECRDINYNLVRAQETRRILDRLFGYRLSYLLWKKVAFGLSAGRVQSPGLRLIVERERERNSFVETAYASVVSTFFEENIEFTASLLSWEGKRICQGSDFDNKGKMTRKGFLHLTHSKAEDIATSLRECVFEITDITEKRQKIAPPVPFITSTLQQEAYNKLRLSTRQTIRVAQSLYEKGRITYMRTDSPSLSSQAITAARSYISDNFDARYLPEKARVFHKKAKGAQEAHEAIRPAGKIFTHPKESGLSGQEHALYTLIWQRTIASQMTAAEKAIVTMTLKADKAICVSNGTSLHFPGFLSLYTFSRAGEKILPTQLRVGQKISARSIEALSHTTKAPARYNDATLVKRLESLGIGRPSTYAIIINTLIDRDYVRRVKNALIPSLVGVAVTQFLENHFNTYVTYDFTARMEEVLDQIADGTRDRLEYLKEFYHGDTGLDHQIKQKESVDENEARKITIPSLHTYELRVGKYGPYVVFQQSGETKSFSIPNDCPPADINETYIKDLSEKKEKGPQLLGHDSKTGLNVYLLIGRYGPYVQLGDVTEENKKPKRASIPSDMRATPPSLEQALKLLSLPRVVGIHPETKKEIVVTRGRFGPYLSCGTETRSLKKEDDVYTIHLERALELLATFPRTRKRSSMLVKDLGAHPTTKRSIAIYKGPYGLYIKYGTKNIRLPEKKTENEVKEITAKEIIPLL